MRVVAVAAVSTVVALGGLSTACAVTEQEHMVGSSVEVRWSIPEDMGLTVPLRWAVVWPQRVAEAAGAEGAEGEGAEDESIGFALVADGLVISEVFDIPLSVPDASLWTAAMPVESLLLGGKLTTVCYRPRILLYLDHDHSGGFAPSFFGGAGEDQVVAIDGDGGSICFLPDLESALQGGGLEFTDTYYAMTDRRFTPFVRVIAYGADLLMDREVSPLELRLADSPVPGMDLACMRAVYGSRSPSIFATSRVSAFVDTPLETGTFCGPIFPECQEISFEAMDIPDVSSLDNGTDLRVAQCRTAERVEVLVVQQARLECEDCSCFTVAHSDVYFAEPSALPSWWPCGDTVLVCESDLPLYTLDPQCLQEPASE